MKKLILTFALIGLVAGSAKADLDIGTSNPAGSPLMMTAGTTSGLMTVNVGIINNSLNNMAAWQFGLMIAPLQGATGTLLFQDPGTGNPSPPPNYVFGDHGVGISVTNGGNTLSANDFDNNLGTLLSPPATNLLQIDFSTTTTTASGLFGVYAVEGSGNTVWTDNNFTTNFFGNVPDGNDDVLIGEVEVNAVVATPAPMTLTMALLAVGTVLMFRAWTTRKSPRPETVCLS